MNRQELSWALSAVLPHAGKRSVGLEQRDDQLFVYATDAYTIAVATVPRDNQVTKCLLTAKEAGELERWVRPQYVAEREQTVLLIAEPDSLHVGFLNPDGSLVRDEDDEPLTGVFNASDGSELDKLSEVITKAREAKTEHLPVAVNPAFLARFVKVGEKVRIESKTLNKAFNVWFVEAPNFLGVIAGLARWAMPEQSDLHDRLAS